MNNVIDRDIVICLRILDIGFGFKLKIVWWKVDFGKIYNLYNMVIFFRSYDGEGMYMYN